jgi:hypothetical protein
MGTSRKVRKVVASKIAEFNRKKRSCLTVKSKKNCFLNALIINISLYEKQKLFTLSDRNRRRQPKVVFKKLRALLRKRARRRLGFHPKKVSHWSQYLEKVGFKVVILQGDLHFKVVTNSSQTFKGKELFLVRYKNNLPNKKRFHYDVVKSPKGYFGKGYVCNVCYKFSKSKLIHCCSFKCYMCKSDVKHDRVSKLTLNTKCTKCNRYFYGKSCKNIHLTNGVCARKRFCDTCFSCYIENKKKKHWCSPDYCKTCKCDHLPGRHFIKGEIGKPKLTEYFLIFDFETFAEKEDKKMIEKAYLCVSRLYKIEYDTTSEVPEIKNTPSYVEKIFEGLNSAKEFFDYVISGEIPQKQSV